MSLRGSQHRPLIFAIEDLHWIDRTSDNYLSFLGDALAGAAMLVLCTYRPGYRPPWIDKSYATQIGIRALSSSDSLAVVRSLLGEEDGTDEIGPTILGKAEGNPFFLEELSRVALQSPDLCRGPTVPETVQDVLVARIDRLPDVSKHVLQIAAVLGREAPLELLAALWQGPSLDTHLAELRRHEFLFERTGTNTPAYVFTHALTRDVAYAGLLTTQRQALHAAAGRSLEALYADRLERVYDRLAYHYAESTDSAKAVEYGMLVAMQAGRSYAHAEALSTLDKVLPHVERLPEQERDRQFFEVLNQQGTALFYLGQFQEVLNRLRPHEAQLNRLSDPSIASDYYSLLTTTSSFLGDRQGAPRYGQRALEEAERGGLRVAVGKAHVALTSEHYFSGRIREAIAHGRQAVAILDQTAEQALLATAHCYLGGAYLFASELDLALDSATRSCEIGQMIGDRRVQTVAGVVCSFAHTWRGAWDKAIEAGERALEMSPDPFETALALGAVGVAHLERGNVDKALEILEMAVEAATRFRSRQIQASWKAYLAEGYLMAGRLEAARTLGLEALQISRDTGYALGVGQAQRTLGRTAQATGMLEEAQTYLNQALEALTSVNARNLISRTYLDLASLANARGDREAMAASLQSAYSVFTALNAPHLVSHTERLAVESGITLRDSSASP